MEKFYVVIDGGTEFYVLSSVDGTTIADCERSIRWQKQGGFDVSKYHICRPDPQARGVFTDAKSGDSFATGRGALTAEAYTQLLNRIWS